MSFVLREITPETADAARILFREYENELAVDLCFQSFEEELANLPGKYSRPSGILWVAEREGVCAGCVAVRPMFQGVAELKRLYVRPPFRGSGLGRLLAVECESFAISAGYQAMRLDTLTRLTPAIRLYEKLGYVKLDQASDQESLEIVYFEKQLN